MTRRIVITGLGAVSAAGVGVDALWAAVREGRTCGCRINGFDTSAMGSKIAAACDAFNPADAGLTPEESARMDRSTQFAVASAREALASAGLLDPSIDRQRAGVLMGTAIGGVGFMEQVFSRVCLRQQKTPPRVHVRADEPNADIYSAYLAYSASNAVAERFQFTGPCNTMATGCTAGLDAIGAAADAIQCDMADVMVTGGVDAPITPIVVVSFDVIKTLSRRNDAPTRASRPFDRDRDGFLLAEGCGVVTLEEEEHAKRRGAPILARLLSYASRSNAFHMTSLPPDGVALGETIAVAITRAGISADDVDYINAHGSSTQQNDRNETSAFKRVFGRRVYDIPVSGTKSVIGHTLGAASALETVVCVCALLDGIIPPTANYDTPCPECDLDYVPNVPRPRALEVVECNASGFSGIHSAAILSHPEFCPA
jgi:3-oxoacyl-(acyl-carrier-protein) synthase